MIDTISKDVIIKYIYSRTGVSIRAALIDFLKLEKILSTDEWRAQNHIFEGNTYVMKLSIMAKKFINFLN